MRKQKYSVPMIVFGVVLLCTSCRYITNDVNSNDISFDMTGKPLERIYDESGEYIFNIDEILTNLHSGTTPEYVISTEDTMQIFPDEDTEYLTFSEEEYLEIAEDFFSYHWKNDVNDWKLKEITYRVLNCEKGFDYPIFVVYQFEKEFENSNQYITSTRIIVIKTWVETIFWHEFQEERRVDSDSIKTDEIIVSGEDAYIETISLFQSEYSGNLDGCRDIYVENIASRSADWHVDIYNDQSRLFNIFINVKDGSYKVE